MDKFLKSFSDKYDKWREEGGFEFSSKVIPVKESLVAQQWVLPGEQGTRNSQKRPVVCAG